MKLKLSQLNSNPFSDGELDKEQIKILASSMKGVGFQGALEVQQNPKTHQYHIVFGHHRKEAAIKVFGKNYQIDVVSQKWDEESLMRGMANENLTQTHDPSKMIREIVNIRNYLKEKNPRSDSVHGQSRTSKGTFDKESGSTDNIIKWLNAKGEIVSHTKVKELLSIHDNLAPELREKIDKGATNQPDADDNINYTNAVMLSSLEDHKEQKEVLKAFKESKSPRAYRVRTRQKILTQYKEAPEEEKKLIREGKKDIALVGIGTDGTGEQNELQPLTIEERFIKVQDALYEVQKEIDFIEPYIEKASPRTLEKMGLFLKSFVDKSLTPFAKKVIIKLGKNEKLKGGIYWTNENE